MKKNDLVLVRAAFSLTKSVEMAGLRVTQEFDFGKLDAEFGEACDRAISEQFSEKYFDFTPDNAFWLRVVDSEDRPVSCQAVRVDRIKGISLRDHWAQQQRRIYCEPYRDQEPELGTNHPEAIDTISGLVGYHGEMWLSRSWRGNSLGQPLCRLGQILTLLRWDIDYIYCFISNSLIHKGFGADQGYSHYAPMGTHWITAPSHIASDDWLCWNGPAEISRLSWAIIQ